MTGSEHLRAILNAIYGDYPQVIAISERPECRPDWADGPIAGHPGVHRPSHVVLDVEGDIIGRGLSGDEAVANAIMSSHEWDRERILKYQRAIRAYRSARLELDNLV
jgi:hypothetical protein